MTFLSPSDFQLPSLHPVDVTLTTKNRKVFPHLKCGLLSIFFPNIPELWPIWVGIPVYFDDSDAFLFFECTCDSYWTTSSTIHALESGWGWGWVDDLQEAEEKCSSLFVIILICLIMFFFLIVPDMAMAQTYEPTKNGWCMLMSIIATFREGKWPILFKVYKQTLFKLATVSPVTQKVTRSLRGNGPWTLCWRPGVVVQNSPPEQLGCPDMGVSLNGGTPKTPQNHHF